MTTLPIPDVEEGWAEWPVPYATWHNRDAGTKAKHALSHQSREGGQQPGPHQRIVRGQTTGISSKTLDHQGPNLKINKEKEFFANSAHLAHQQRAILLSDTGLNYITVHCQPVYSEMYISNHALSVKIFWNNIYYTMHFWPEFSGTLAFVFLSCQNNGPSSCGPKIWFECDINMFEQLFVAELCGTVAFQGGDCVFPGCCASTSWAPCSVRRWPVSGDPAKRLGSISQNWFLVKARKVTKSFPHSAYLNSFSLTSRQSFSKVKFNWR